MIHSNIYIYGKYASRKLARKYEKALLNSWGRIKKMYSDGASYRIKWKINVIYKGNNIIEESDMDFSNSKSNYLDVTMSTETSSVKNAHKGNIRPIINNNNDMIHEFGHILGLKDKYITDKNNPNFRDAIEGFEGNVMAEEAGKGIVEPMNVTDVLFPIFASGLHKKVYFLNTHNSESRRK